jgi:secreted trypsin-like serine protease
VTQLLVSAHYQPSSQIQKSCFLVLISDRKVRIINGENAAPGQFPWAGLMISDGALCSCSLVRADWVVTAGHCVDHVGSGDVWFGNPHRGSSGEVHRRFVQVVMHPHYNGGGSDDIAVVRLESPYQLSDTIQTIALPDGEWFRDLRHFHFFFSFLLQTNGSGMKTNGAT